MTSPEDVLTAPDLVILAVKGFDTATALLELSPVLSDKSVILSLQNGVENEARIAEALPHHPILAGAICAYTEFPAPGEVLWRDDRGGLAGAHVAGSEEHTREVWERILPATGMHCLFVEGPLAATRVKWCKLMLNVAFNALNALTGLPTPELLAHKEHGPLAVAALREAFEVMAAKEILPVDLPGYEVTRMAKVLKLPLWLARRIFVWKTARDTGGASSMRQDIQKKRASTEIDEINGAIVRYGETCGVSTPANAQLVQMMARRVQE